MGHDVDPFLEIMEGAIVVQDGMGMTGVAESPIKASMYLSKTGESKGIMGFERFVTNDVSICGFVVAVISSSGGVSVGHLSG